MMTYLSASNTRFRDQILLTFGTAVFLNVIGLFTGIIAARVLGPTGRGELAIVQLWGSFLATLSLVGIPEAVLYYSARYPERAREYCLSGLCLAPILGLPILLLGVLSLPWILSAQSFNVITVTQWYAIGFFSLLVLSLIPLNALRALRRFAEWNFLRSFSIVSWLVVLSLAAFLRSTSLYYIAYSYLGVYAVLSVLILIVSFRKLTGGYTFSIRLWLPMAKLGLPMMLSLIPTYLMQNGRLSQIFISAFLKPETLGFFAVAVGWSNIARIVPEAIAAVVFPRVAAKIDVASQADEIAKGTRWVVALLIPICLILIISSPIVVPFLFGANFSPAIPVSMILVAAASVNGIKVIFSYSLRGLGKAYLALIAELLAVSLTALMFYALLPLGANGAAVAILIGDTIAMLLLLVIVTRSVKSSAFSLLKLTINDLRSIAFNYKNKA